jgi:hypothetical protein
MANANHRQEDMNEQDIDSIVLDRQLDAALAEFAVIEPRVGLEERVLANLRVQCAQAPAHAWFGWAAAAALAVVIILVASLLWSARKPHLVNAPQPVIQQPVGDIQIASHPVLPPQNTGLIRKSATNRMFHSADAATNPPRLSQFPSPEAMSDQEKMLADYAAAFQEQAVLIARFNEEDLRRDRMELVEKARQHE